MSGAFTQYVKRHHLGLVAVFIALGGGAYAATQPGPDGDIDACFSKKSGQLYVMKKKKCGKGRKAISWAQAGPRGPQGATGPAGPAGSARAYGRVNADGTVTAASPNVSVTNEGGGTYCIAVPGATPSTRPMVVSVDYNASGVQMGSSTFVATDQTTDDPVQPSGSRAPFAMWDAINDVCPAGQYEVRTFEQRLDAFANTFATTQKDVSFAFVLP